MKKIFILTFLTISIYGQDTIKPISLNDIEVTGVRTSTTTPISQKTITKDDIAKSYQGQEMSYILDKTPSIISQSDGGQPNGYTTIRLRGIDQTRINMTLNGVPLNEPEDQGVYFSNYPNFAINLKSMQIQRGVGTSANGTSSYGGSINFEGKTGVEKEATAQVGYGSFNTQRINATYGSGIDKKLALYTGISAYRTDGYKYNSSGNGYSAFISGGFYDGKNVIKFTGFNGHAVNQMAWLAVSEKDIDQDPKTNYNLNGENDEFDQSLGQLQYVRALTKKSTITTTAYYNHLSGLWGMFVYDEDTISPTFGEPTSLLNFKLKSNFYGLMSNYHLETSNLNLNIGLHGNSYNRTHIGILDTMFLYRNTGYKIDYSGYTKAEYTMGKFNLYGDIQLRNVEFKYVGDTIMAPLSWFFINPKGGITYNHSNSVNYYLSIGKTNREPTRTDMFGGQDNLISLNIITPEQVIDYEIGSNIKTAKLNLQYNCYFMDFKNEITLLGALGSNGLPLMTNVSQSFRSGLEIDVKYKIFNTLMLTNSSNYSYCRIKNGSNMYQPLYTPNLIINQGIEYSINGLNFGLLGRYSSKSYLNSDNTLTIPDYFIVNANIGYVYKHITVLIQGINLTNKRYYTSGYGIGSDRYFFVNAPISGYLTLKISL